MKKSFQTKIVFKRSLSQEEKLAFWNNAIDYLQEIAVSGTPQYDNNLDCSIDETESCADEVEVKQHFSNFLKKQNEIIKYYSFYNSSAA